MEVKTNTPRQSQKVAEKFAKTLEAGDVIALYGDLGAGKTIFAQGIAKGLKIKRKITSPTFVFMRSYSFIKNKQPLTFYHLDLYRGEENSDFRALGLEEIFSQDSIVVLEWAEKITKSLPKKRIDITIERVNEKTRKIKIRRIK
jgi:tRNA threonylcarbamoyladenosine biosynthesis protein TsaE